MPGQFQKWLDFMKEKEWDSYYIAYQELKDRLRQILKHGRKKGHVVRASWASDDEELGKIGSETLQLLNKQRSFSLTATPVAAPDDVFSKALDKEVEKVVIFFLEAQGEIAHKVLHLRICMRGLPVDEAVFERMASDDSFYSTLSSSKEINQIKGVETPKSDGISSRVFHPADLVKEYREICEDLCRLLTFLEVNAEVVRKILSKHDRILMADERIAGSYLSTRASKNPDGHIRQLFFHNGVNAILSSLKSAIEEMPSCARTLPESMAIEPSDKQAIKDMFESLEEVRQARTRVRKTTSFISFLSLKPLIFDQQEMELGDIMGLPHELSVWLNIIQIFLSTVNAYITVPTTNAYAEEVGVDAAYSGVIIGMSPIAQIFSALVFSYWSNYAFKAPLLVSCLLQLLGNILYGSALRYKSLWLLLAGRFLGGAGTAEAVNRRYIADVIPPAERTAASVAFVTASAIGMAAGPGLAAVLYPLDFKVHQFPITAATAPAWLMVVLWGTFLLVMICFFREPLPHMLHRDSKKEDERHHTKMSSQNVRRQASLNVSKVIEGYGSMNETREDEGGGHAVGQQQQQPKVLSRASVSRLESKLAKENLAKIPILVLLWRNKALMITLAVYFLIELADEIILSSAGLIASSYFDWSIADVGGFLALLGLLVLPANYLVGQFSEHGYEDRTIIVTSQAIISVGLLLVISYWGEYTEFQFVVGTFVIFVAVAVMEGVDTSLMSKVIPPALSRGTFNSGLLAVFIGMIAKALGDCMITVIGLSANDLINGLYIPILLITVGLLLISMKYFAKLH